MEELTEREEETYLTICNYVAKYHNFPTHRWLVDHTKATSTSMIAFYLKNLVRKNYLTKKKVNGKHEYVVIDSAWMAPRYMFSVHREDNEESVYWLITQGEEDDKAE